jgi:hypothetical protein
LFQKTFVRKVVRQNTKTKKVSSKYEVRCEAFVFRKNEAFIKIRSERDLRRNTKSKRPSLKYEVKEIFVKIRKQRKLHQNTKAKKASQNTKSVVKPLFFREKMKPSSKYELNCEAFIVQRKTETFIKIRSKSKKPS